MLVVGLCLFRSYPFPFLHFTLCSSFHSSLHCKWSKRREERNDTTNAMSEPFCNRRQGSQERLSRCQVRGRSLFVSFVTATMNEEWKEAWAVNERENKEQPCLAVRLEEGCEERGMLDVPWLAVELREWFASTRSTLFLISLCYNEKERIRRNEG